MILRGNLKRNHFKLLEIESLQNKLKKLRRRYSTI